MDWAYAWSTRNGMDGLTIFSRQAEDFPTCVVCLKMRYQEQSIGLADVSPFRLPFQIGPISGQSRIIISWWYVPITSSRCSAQIIGFISLFLLIESTIYGKNQTRLIHIVGWISQYLLVECPHCISQGKSSGIPLFGRPITSHLASVYKKPMTFFQNRDNDDESICRC